MKLILRQPRGSGRGSGTALWQRSSSTRATMFMFDAEAGIAAAAYCKGFLCAPVLQRALRRLVASLLCSIFISFLSLPFLLLNSLWLLAALQSAACVLLCCCLFSSRIICVCLSVHVTVCVRRHLRSIASGGPLSDFVIALRLLLFSISLSSSVFLAFAAMSGILLTPAGSACMCVCVCVCACVSARALV